MHDTTDQVHWHEPKAGENAGFGKFLRKPMPYDSFMEVGRACRSIAASACAGCRICRCSRGSGSAARGSYIQLYGTEGLWGSYVVEVPGAGALNVERHLYEKIVPGGRRPRLDGSLAGRPDQAPHLRMAEGLAVHDPAQRVPSHRQCVELAGAAPVRHVGAERDEPDRQSELHLQLPAQFHRALLGRGRFLQAERRRRARSDPRARDAAHQFRPRHRQHRAAARQPPLARLPPRRAADGQQPLLRLDRRARDRPLFEGAQARLGGRADLRQGQGLHLHLAGGARHDSPGRTARPTRFCARITSRSAWFRPRR